MEHEIANHPLERIVCTLAAARRRIQARRLMAALMATATTAIVGWLAIGFFASSDTARLARWMFGLWLACSTAAAFVAIELAPPLQKLAQIADRQFGLKERLSTAFELSNRTQRGLIASALLRDAASIEARIRITELAPLAPRDWRLPAMLFVAAALAFGTQAQRRAPAPPQMQAATSVPDTYKPDALEMLAANIEKDATERQDPYLKAVAQQLRKIAAETAATSATDSAARNVEAAIEHAANAYRDDAPKWLAGQIGAGLREQLRNFAANARQPAAAEQPASQTAPAQPQATTASSTQAGGAAQSGPRPAASTPGAAESALADASENSFADGDYQLSPEDQARLNREREIALQQRQSSPGAGQPVSGAQEAGKGGNMAGEGVQSAQAAEGAILQRQTADEVALQSAEPGVGRTIRMDIVPEAGARAAAPAGETRGAWVASTETPVARDASRLEHPEAARRFFTPVQGEASARAAR